jgi:hypothetical protein
VLAGAQAVAGDRKVVLLRGGADIDHRDVGVADDVLVFECRGRRLGQRLDLGQPVRADLADVQLVDQGRARERLGTDAAAPAGADHCDFDLFHEGTPFNLKSAGTAAGAHNNHAGAAAANGLWRVAAAFRTRRRLDSL